MYKVLMVLTLVLLSSCKIFTETEAIEFVIWLNSKDIIEFEDCLRVKGCVQIDDTDTLLVAFPEPAWGKRFTRWRDKEEGAANMCPGTSNACVLDSTVVAGDTSWEEFFANCNLIVDLNPVMEDADMADEPAKQCQSFKPYLGGNLIYKIQQGDSTARLEVLTELFDLDREKKEVYAEMREQVSVFDPDTDNLLSATTVINRTLLNPGASLDSISRESEEFPNGDKIVYLTGRPHPQSLSISNPTAEHTTTVRQTVNGNTTEFPVNYKWVYKGWVNLSFRDGTTGTGCEYEEQQTVVDPIFGEQVSVRHTIFGGRNTHYPGAVIRQLDIDSSGVQTDLIFDDFQDGIFRGFRF